MSLLFYDFEVFKKDWLVVIIDAMNKKEYVIINNQKELQEIYNENKQSIWVGYNSKFYDQYIMKGILCGFNPKEINDFIIVDGNEGYKFSKLLNNFPLINFDVMFGDKTRSLKQLEGFMGESIKESNVDFNINRKLTEEEIQETIEYCRHDVEQTIKIFTKRKSEFQSIFDLLKMFNLSLSDIGKTKPQISAYILGASIPVSKRERAKDEFEISFPDTLKIQKYTNVVDWYKENRDYEKTMKTIIAGVPFVFGWGGLHGARERYNESGIFINVDVASYYPALMIEYDYLSRNVQDPEKYREIRDLRIKYKREKNKLADPLKIVLNSTYGAMKDLYNSLFDPLQANNVCVGGQLLLLDLIEKLEDYCEIIQANTDGILIKIDSMSKIFDIDDILVEWEERTRLNLEVDLYDRIDQKDVNNYIISKTLPNNEKYYKSKGAYVKGLDFLDYDLPIVNKAVVEKIVFGKPVEQTINAEMRLIEFQKIVKKSSKYNYCIYNREKLNEKTFRIFASNDEKDSCLFKVKIDPETGSPKNPESFSGFKDVKVKILNGNIIGERVPEWLDKNYYMNLAKTRLEQFGIK